MHFILNVLLYFLSELESSWTKIFVKPVVPNSDQQLRRVRKGSGCETQRNAKTTCGAVMLMYAKYMQESG